MFKYTKHTLKKTEEFFKSIGYTIRYEKGNFQSGYCLVENKKVIVVNRFYDTEARIQCLLDIISVIELDVDALDDKNREWYNKMLKSFQISQESE